MSTILDKIAADKRNTVRDLQLSLPYEKLLDQMPEMESHRFKNALADPEEMHIIAEIKKASPSRGVLIADFRPTALAEKYARGGAAAISVLTESKYFQGSFDHLRTAAEASGLPVLCKDFILEPYQVYHARYNRADAILLIVALLSKSMLVECMECALDLGMDCLVEVHDENELRTAVEIGVSIIGVNNRNLRDFSVKLETSERLSAMMPDGVVRVTESGIFSREDVNRLSSFGFNAFLVGEALVKADDPEELIKTLRGK